MLLWDASSHVPSEPHAVGLERSSLDTRYSLVTRRDWLQHVHWCAHGVCFCPTEIDLVYRVQQDLLRRCLDDAAVRRGLELSANQRPSFLVEHSTKRVPVSRGVPAKRAQLCVFSTAQWPVSVCCFMGGGTQASFVRGVSQYLQDTCPPCLCCEVSCNSCCVHPTRLRGDGSRFLGRTKFLVILLPGMVAFCSFYWLHCITGEILPLEHGRDYCCCCRLCSLVYDLASLFAGRSFPERLSFWVLMYPFYMCTRCATKGCRERANPSSKFIG